PYRVQARKQPLAHAGRFPEDRYDKSLGKQKYGEEYQAEEHPRAFHDELSPHQVDVAAVAEQLDRQSDTALAQPCLEPRYDAGGAELSLHIAVLVQPPAFELEELRSRDHIALHAIGLLQAHDTPAAIFLALDLNQDVDRGGDLATQRL